MANENTYPGFGTPVSELVKFVYVLGSFIIVLKTAKIIHFRPEDAKAFHKWLLENNIREIK